MEYGYICFAYSKGVWYDWCIAKVTSSQWSHSFITVPPMLGSEMVMEADESGVAMCEFAGNYRGNSGQKYEVYKFVVTPASRDAAIQSCMGILETQYGYLEYPWLMWRYLNRLFGRDIKSHNNWSRNGTICSGLVRKYMEGCGANLFQGFGIDAVAPEDIYQIVKARPDLFSLVESQS